MGRRSPMLVAALSLVLSVASAMPLAAEAAVPRQGGPLADRLVGGDAADTLRGMGSSDTLIGNGGDDRLFGGSAPDLIYGGDGNDWITGGGGKDTIHTGVGLLNVVVGGDRAAGDLPLHRPDESREPEHPDEPGGGEC